MNLGSLKKKLSKKKDEEASPVEEDVEIKEGEKAQKAKIPPKIDAKKAKAKKAEVSSEEEPAEEAPRPRAKARSHSAFAEPQGESSQSKEAPSPKIEETPAEELKPEVEEVTPTFSEAEEPVISEAVSEEPKPPVEPQPKANKPEPSREEKPAKKQEFKNVEPRKIEPKISSTLLGKKEHSFLKDLPVREKFGPTGKHVKDLLPKKSEAPPPKPKPKSEPATSQEVSSLASKGIGTASKSKGAKFKEFRDLKPAKKSNSRGFDSRDSRGLRGSDDDSRWRRKKQKSSRQEAEDTTIRPTELTIRLPITIKELAQEMKLKASELLQKLFMQGVITTLNDEMDDAETVQLLGMEFGCTIHVDTSEEERIQITGKTIEEEIREADEANRVTRAPVVAFMGHVDHGKTSLIDYIRKTNVQSGEAGAITQHIGAFMCHTAVGEIAILDTPGHEAFSAMRERGANVTDIIVLVIAGDEGIRQQTIEAINHAKAGNVNIVVAINKCDKPNFNAENVYRQLSEQELLPEAWGGEIITVNCSAETGEGISNLLDMLALQAEVLELKAVPEMRARGTVIESELHKGLGSKATILVQNGTLKKGDALVFEEFWGKVKTMHDETGKEVEKAGPSHPVEITGLSGLPDAGQEFIVVASEKEAKEISQKRSLGIKQNALKIKKSFTMEHMLESSKAAGKKTLNVVLRADVQGSLEALKTALGKIKSEKAELNVVHMGVGEISESDVQLAAASKAVIVGFHTAIESHAETLVKEMKVEVVLHDIIYHAVDDVKRMMKELLDKIPQENEQGKALVKAVFKSSHLGMIAGCQVTEGVINRNHLTRVVRAGEVIFKGTIASLKKVKEDVREVAKGIECGILLNGFNDPQPDDIIEAYDITYLTQEL
ncbi:MAG: translation initiation factor IF-2 [Chlamydiia bacterium]|nr:translation initiation factor IF-2 [Chlamydiia bacterium]